MKRRIKDFCMRCMFTSLLLLHFAISLAHDDGQSMINDNGHTTRGTLQYTDANSIFTVAGYLLCNGNANVLCGSLNVDGAGLAYDTSAYHINPTVTPLFQSNAQHKNAIILQNRLALFFTGKQYTVQQLLDGTSNAWSFDNHCIFRTGNTGVSGFVRFDNGFTILPDASTVFDTFITANGGIDFRETGVLVLGGALGLGSSVTLSSGGKIDGRGNQLVLGGDLTFPANKILHIMSDTVIDGLGHTLTVGDYGQLFVDNAVTLTLQNMIFSSGAKTSAFPPLRCAGSQSKLVLDNVTLLPGADIPFYQGQMFVYDDVHFSGTSALVYTSPQSSFIMPISSLTFDPLTTFSFATATASKDQIVMSDATSSLVFDGSTLKCTDTGLRLTKGTLTYQGNVTVDTKSSLYLSGMASVAVRHYGANIYGLAWRSDGRFLVVGGNNPVNGSTSGFSNTDGIRLYSFDGVNLNPATSRAYGNSIKSLAWSQDGQYVAVSGIRPTNGGTTGFSNVDEIRIYRFDEATLTLIPVTSRRYGSSCYSLQWSPDGRYLAVTGSGPVNGDTSGFSDTNIFRLYGFDGQALTPIASDQTWDSGYSVAWHPSGKFIMLAGGDGSSSSYARAYLYGFDGTSLTLLNSITTRGLYYPYFYRVEWAPNGQYIGLSSPYLGTADGNIQTGDKLRIYSFNGVNMLTPITGYNYYNSESGEVHALGWSPDGKQVVIGGYWLSQDQIVKVLRFDGTNLALTANVYYNSSRPVLEQALWDPSGNFLAFGGQDINNSVAYLNVSKSVWGNQPNQQAATNSLVYGNSALGSSANLTVNGNYSTLRGNVLNQNV